MNLNVLNEPSWTGASVTSQQRQSAPRPPDSDILTAVAYTKIDEGIVRIYPRHAKDGIDLLRRQPITLYGPGKASAFPNLPKSLPTQHRECTYPGHGAGTVHPGRRQNSRAPKHVERDFGL